ncbi:ribosome biogenesis GTPase Der [Magnetovibrio sp. PR-2]|uniref:ribosome biogenesis GTPase Der n=1 Tax=Magnetovibrio sp. PR-2 TaxID=3120356 RepID=UPI002FCE0E7F
MSFTVAIIGRPNVGKSTLFNRLVGKRVAIVDDMPGVTRDRREGDASISDMTFRIIDTAGLEDAHDESLESRMREQTEAAFFEADVGLMMIDARTGLTPLDEHFANWLRRHDTPVILVANKCEGAAGQPGLLEAYALGLGDPVPLSAEHGEGLADLYDALRPYAEAAEDGAYLAEEDAPLQDSGDEKDDAKILETPLQLAVVGRPNVGKSTLINKLLGEERLLTGPEAGITRDSITVPWTYQGREFKLVDTAGLRRRAKVTEKVEALSGAETRRAIDFAQVVALVLDARDMLEKQDLTIARNVIEEGRALVVVVNKWDLIKDNKEALQRLHDRMQTSLPQVRGIPIVTVSAKTGKGLSKILDNVLDVFDVWNRRVSTARLNRWLEDILEYHQPPLVGGRRIKVRYMTQPKTRPPTFALFCSHAKGLPEAYSRYLANALREDFDLWGVPLRIVVRKGHNPFAKD